MKILRSAILVALALITVISAISCDKTSGAQKAPTTTNQEKEDDPVINTYEPLTVKLSNNTPGIKILGVRNLPSGASINADWTCSGIEFYADCEGELSVTIDSSNPCYYRVYVDGEPYLNGTTPYFTVDQKTEIKVENIERGKHLFRFVKATGYTLAKSAFRSVKLNGLISSEAPKDNELYLEFVGDSICCGWGVIPDATGAYNGTYASQDGTLAYPYLISTQMNADYSICALSGQGLLCGNPGTPLGYKYGCYEKNAKREYDFARKADVVIINIGTNDYSQQSKLGITKIDFQKAYVDFINLVKEKNGDDCKIILVYNVMNDTFASSIMTAVNSLGGERANLYLFKADRTSRERGNSHPSENENKAYAEKIGKFIQEVLAK